MTRIRVRRQRPLVLSIACLLLFLHALPAYGAGLWSDVRYERPSSGYEGTYEWRGVMAKTYVYDWSLPSTGAHVSSVYIHHPNWNYLRFMEIGVFRYWTFSPTIFISWCTSYDDPNQVQTVDLATLPLLSSQKLLIRNMTMGDVNTGWQRWIMSWNDLIVFDQTHPLTYGQAWSSSETAVRGHNNRAYFFELKRTSRPASWTNWTASTVRADQDPYYDFQVLSQTAWKNIP